MTFQFDIGDRVRVVEIHRDVSGHRVIVDGRAHHVEAAPVGSSGWSLIVRDADGSRARSVDAVIAPRPGNGTVDVHIEGYRIPVHLRNGMSRRSRDAGSAGGPQRVAAPMPGKVVRLLVKPGDVVQPRQALVVVEAMKMENEVRAVKGGRVRDVFVREGQSVEAGTPLVTLD
jgi:acetyl/propionyl-CoA carboxylase alpha subunit